MSVLLETSLGEIVVDLLVENAPKLCEKYVSNCIYPYQTLCISLSIYGSHLTPAV